MCSTDFPCCRLTQLPTHRLSNALYRTAAFYVASQQIARQRFDALSKTIARGGHVAVSIAMARDIFGEFASPLSSEAREDFA